MTRAQCLLDLLSISSSIPVVTDTLLQYFFYHEFNPPVRAIFNTGHSIDKNEVDKLQLKKWKWGTNLTTLYLYYIIGKSHRHPPSHRFAPSIILPYHYVREQNNFEITSKSVDIVDMIIYYVPTRRPRHRMTFV